MEHIDSGRHPLIDRLDPLLKASGELLLGKTSREGGDVLEQVLAVQECFHLAGKPHLIGPYAELLTVCLGKRRSEYTLEMQFPFLETEAATAELEALSGQGRTAPALFKLMKFLLVETDKSFRFHVPTSNSSISSRMASRAEMRKYFLSQNCLDLTKLCSDTEVDGEEEVDWVLGLCETHEWLEGTLPTILRHYSRIQASYPGGLRKLVSDLEFISGYDLLPAVYTNYVGWVVNDKSNFAEISSTADGLDRHLRYAKNLAMILGEDAGEFLRNGELNSAAEPWLANEDSACDQMEQVYEFEERNIHPLFPNANDAYKASKWVRMAYIKNYGDPRLADFLEGFEYLCSLFKPFMASQEVPVRKEALESVYLAIQTYCESGIAAISPREHAATVAHAHITEVKSGADIRWGWYGHQSLVAQGLPPTLATHLGQINEFRVFELNINPYLALSPEGLEFLKSYLAHMGLMGEILGEASAETFTADFRGRLKTLAEAFELMLTQTELLQAYPGLDVFIQKCLRELEAKIGMCLWRGALGVKSGHFKPSEWLSGTNPATQMVVVGEAMLRVLDKRGAAGALRPQLALLGSSESMEGVIASFEQLERSMRDDLGLVIPQVETAVRANRAVMPGLMVEGAKVHTPASMNLEAFDMHLGVFGVGGVRNTPFKLLHGGHTLVLPPMPTVFELQLMLRLFHVLGTIDQNDLDLQGTMAGPWGPERAAMVGSSILLQNQRVRLYEPDAFASTHEETASRIMVREARQYGVRFTDVPYDVPEKSGRLDLMAQVDPGFLFPYQLLGTLANHLETDRPLAGHMRTFEREFMRILAGHELGHLIFETSWMNMYGAEIDDPLNHGRVTRQVVEAGLNRPRLKVEVRGLIQEVRKGVLDKRQAIIDADPEEYERYMAF